MVLCADGHCKLHVTATCSNAVVEACQMRGPHCNMFVLRKSELLGAGDPCNCINFRRVCRVAYTTLQKPTLHPICRDADAVLPLQARHAVQLSPTSACGTQLPSISRLLVYTTVSCLQILELTNSVQLVIWQPALSPIP